MRPAPLLLLLPLLSACAALPKFPMPEMPDISAPDLSKPPRVFETASKWVDRSTEVVSDKAGDLGREISHRTRSATDKSLAYVTRHVNDDSPPDPYRPQVPSAMRRNASLTDSTYFRANHQHGLNLIAIDRFALPLQLGDTASLGLDMPISPKNLALQWLDARIIPVKGQFRGQYIIEKATAHPLEDGRARAELVVHLRVVDAEGVVLDEAGVRAEAVTLRPLAQNVISRRAMLRELTHRLAAEYDWQMDTALRTGLGRYLTYSQAYAPLNEGG